MRVLRPNRFEMIMFPIKISMCIVHRISSKSIYNIFVIVRCGYELWMYGVWMDSTKKQIIFQTIIYSKKTWTQLHYTLCIFYTFYPRIDPERSIDMRFYRAELAGHTYFNISVFIIIIIHEWSDPLTVHCTLCMCFCMRAVLIFNFRLNSGLLSDFHYSMHDETN